MKESVYEQNSQKLQILLKKAGFKGSEDFSKISGISQWQLTRLQYGLMHRMPLETLLNLSASLKISLVQLITTFVSESNVPNNLQLLTANQNSTIESQEYQRLQTTIEQQERNLTSEFQSASLQAIESWLLQWPTAVAAISKNPELPAERLLLLMKPIEELISTWGVQNMYEVGEELPYDPQWQELMKGDANPGDMVQVRYVGYKQNGNLLYKAKVSTLSVNSNQNN